MTQVTNTPYEALEVGQKATYSKTVEERDIQLFAAISGDHNPVHLDAEFAKATMFKERIAHGMFSGALISAAVWLPWAGHHLYRPADELPEAGENRRHLDRTSGNPRRSCPSSACGLPPRCSTSVMSWWWMAKPRSLRHANSRL